MEDTRGLEGATGGRDGVVGHIHRLPEDGSSTVGGSMTTPGGLCKGKHMSRGEKEETTIV